MPPRDLSSKLDERRHREAEVVTATVVRPGPTRGSHIIRFPGSDAEIVASSTDGSKSFGPGAVVSVGRPDGSREPEVIGGPPPGMKGGASFGTRRMTPAPAPSVARPYYGFLDFGDAGWQAWRYIDGEPDGLLGVFDGSVTYVEREPTGVYHPEPASPVSPLFGDPTGRMPDGSWVISGGDCIGTWNPVTRTAFYRHLPSINDFMSEPGWTAGHVWWFESLHDDENPDLSFTTFTLYRADADLANITAIGTAAPFYGTGGLARSGRLMLSATAAEVGFSRTIVRIGLNGGGAGSVAFDGSQGNETAVPCGGGALSVYDADRGFFAGTVKRRPDVLGAPFAATLPTTAPWRISFLFNVGASADGATGTAYVTRSESGLSTDALVLVFPAAAPGASPAKVFAVQPVDGIVPSYLAPGY